MLKSSHHYAWSDSLLCGKFLDGPLAEACRFHKLGPSHGTAENVRCPLVGLRLQVGRLAIRTVYEHCLLAMEYQVCRLVEQAEPEVIVALVTRAKLDYRGAW